MWNPLSWVMEAAALVAIVLSNGEGMPPDWEDFLGIVFLLFINSTIGFYEERNAGNAVKDFYAQGLSSTFGLRSKSLLPLSISSTS